jgi:hypothetical protein
MIDHSKKIIFIAIPKTGTKTIDEAIGGFIDRHCHEEAAKLKFKFGEAVFNQYFKFCFARNPWDKILSEFKFMKKRLGEHKSGTLRINNNPHWPEFGALDKMDFKTFITGGSEGKWSLPPSNLYWMTDSSGQIIVDFVGKFENLQKDFDFVCDKIEIPRQELPHKNKTKHKHYTEYYDEETKQIVAEKYAKDIERFGYKFVNKK